jgi:hypothetical protein
MIDPVIYRLCKRRVENIKINQHENNTIGKSKVKKEHDSIIVVAIMYSIHNDLKWIFVYGPNNNGLGRI